MTDINIGFSLAGLCLGMLIGILLGRWVEIYRKKREMDD